MNSTSIGKIGFDSSFGLAISADGTHVLVNENPRLRMGCGPTLPESPLYMVNRDGSGLRNLPLDFTPIWPEVLKAKRIAERGW